MLSDIWEEFRDGILTAIAVIVAIGVLICCIGGFSYVSDKVACNGYHENAGVETKYEHNGILSWECFVKVNGNWVPADKWRGVND